MKKLSRGLVLMTVVLTIQSMFSAAVAKNVTEQDLHKCYSNYPFLIDLLVNVSDVDFKDSSKRLVRVTEILDGIKKKPEYVQECLNNVKTFAKNTEDLNTVLFVTERLKEVSQFQVLYQIPRIHPNVDVGQK